MANYFKTISCPSGTNPVADSSTDTLTLTNSMGCMAVTGNSTTDTVDLKQCPVVSRIYYSTDFSLAPQEMMSNVISGSGATWVNDLAPEIVGSTYYQGITRLTTAITTNNYSAYTTGLGTLALGVGAAKYTVMIKAPDTLSDATDNYSITAGFFNSYTTPTDGCYFYYNHGTNTKWVLTTIKDTVATSTTSDTTFTVSTWYKLTVVVNAGATSVAFYINDVLKATHTTNIPTGTGDALGAGTSVLRLSTGGTSRNPLLDFTELDIQLTTSR